jgi:hypothetical protein
VGVIEAGSIDETNFGIEKFWDRKFYDRDFVCAGLQAMTGYSIDAAG